MVYCLLVLDLGLNYYGAQRARCIAAEMIAMLCRRKAIPVRRLSEMGAVSLGTMKRKLNCKKIVYAFCNTECHSLGDVESVVIHKSIDYSRWALH